MAINYSLSYRSVKVADLDANGQKQYAENGELIRKKVQKAYASPRTIGALSLEEFTKSVAANGAYSRADILSILIVLEEGIRNMLLLGQRIDLGDLGIFYPSITSAGVLDAKTFTPSAHIKKAYAGWTKAGEMKKLKDVSYSLVATISSQKALNLASKGGATSFNVDQSQSTQDAAQNLELLRSEFPVVVNVKNGQDAYGSVNGSGTYRYGTVVSISAIPNTGYGFAKWTDGSEDNPRSITVTSVHSITAEFYQKSGVVIESFVSGNLNPFKVGTAHTTISITGVDIPESDLVLKMRQNGEWVNTGMTYSSASETEGQFTKNGFTIPEGVDALRVYNGAEPLFTQPVTEA